ncbi:MAG: hypothetical protein JWO00_366, partial [Candidatus Parcubacteria bacterium]|nr:hypothetical protein [Candidatus Parcubacteria bacterium]
LMFLVTYIAIGYKTLIIRFNSLP